MATVATISSQAGSRSTRCSRTRSWMIEEGSVQSLRSVVCTNGVWRRVRLNIIDVIITQQLHCSETKAFCTTAKLKSALSYFFKGSAVRKDPHFLTVSLE